MGNGIQAGTANFKLMADISALQQQMAQVQQLMDATGQKVAGSFAGVGGQIMAALGPVAILAALIAIVRGANNAVDALNDVADATGSTVENISALQRVANLYGHQLDISTTMVMKFNKELASTIKPGSEAESVLKQLGLNAGELRKMDPAEALQRAAIAFQNFEANGERARAMELLFSKATKEGAAYLKDLAESGQLVAIVTTKQAEEAEKFNRELSKLRTTGSDWARDLSNIVVPTLNFTIEQMRKAAQEAGFFAAVIAGWRALLVGNDRQIAAGEMVKLTESLLENENRLLAVQGKFLMGSRTKALQDENAQIKERIRVTQNYLQLLDAQEAKPPEAKKPALALDPQAEAKRLAAATEAQRKAEKELTEQRKRDLQVGELRNKLAGEWAKDEEKKVIELAKGHEEWAKAIQKQTDLQRKNSQEYLDGIDKQIFAASAMVQAAQDEYDTYGMSASQIAKLTLYRLKDARAVQLKTALTSEDLRAIDAQIAAQQKLIAIYEKGELRSANEETARKARDDWDRAFQQVGQSLTDYIMQGGKNGADYLRAMFRTLVLRPIISAAVNPVAGAVTSALGIGGPGGAGSTLSGIGALSGAFGGGLKAGFSALFNEAGFMGAMDAGSLAMGAGNIAGGLGTFAGAAGPYVLAAMAAAKLLGGGETRSGGQYNGTKFLEGPSGGQIDAANVTGAIGGTQATINALLGRLGSSTRLSEFFSGLETSGKGKGFAYAGGALSTGAVFGQGHDGLGRNNRRGNFDAAGAVTAFGEELSQSVLQALQADLDNLPDYVRKYLEGIDVDAMGKDAADKLLASIDAVATQRATLEQQIYELTTSDAQKLADAREAERKTMNESVLSLLDRRNALQDEKVAAAAAAQAAQEKARIEEQIAAQAAQEKARIEEQIANQRSNLQTQLYQLTGNTAALRADVLAALGGDAQSIALQQQVWALEDARRAQELATASANSYASAISTVSVAMDDFTDSIQSYLRKLGAQSSALSGPLATRMGSQQAYQNNLALAFQGNAGARSSITDYADAYLGAVNATSGSAIEAIRATALVRQDLSRLIGSPTDSVTDGIRAMTAEIIALRQEVSNMRAETQATAVASRRSADVLDRVTQFGSAMLTETAT